jgi:hypothetical protein
LSASVSLTSPYPIRSFEIAQVVRVLCPLSLLGAV